MKVHSFIVVAILAYMITLSAAREAEGNTDFSPFIELGQLQNESNASIGAIGFTFKNKWQASRMFIGEGDTEWGRHPKAKAWTFDRIVNPGWFDDHVFMMIGIAKIDTEFLVEPWNYHLGFGWQWKSGKIYYQHFSSADINTQNTGIDAIIWRVNL